MNKLLFVLVFSCFFYQVNAQFTGSDGNRNMFSNDSTSFNKEVQIKIDGETKYTDYKVFTIKNDTTFIDTTLSLKKDSKLNYIRKDDFELLPFHNMGQTYTNLGYSFENSPIFPLMGMNAKQFNYKKVEDIQYYYVPTPTSEIMYRSGLEQGQVLESFVTMNTSRQFNISLAYKGLRSLGKYRYSLASHGNFRTSFNYHNKNKTYDLKGHFSSFDFYNNENGGLTDDSVGYFESGNSNYTDRGRLEVNLSDANNMFEGKRYFIEHTLKIFPKTAKTEEKNEKPKNDVTKIADSTAFGKPPISELNSGIKNKKPIRGEMPKKGQHPENKDVHEEMPNIAIKDSVAVKQDSALAISTSLKDNFELKLGHQFMYETKHYRFNEDSESSIFGDAFATPIADHTSYQNMNNELFVQLKSPITGILRGKASYTNYNYHYNSILFYDNETILNKIKGNAVSIGADWKVSYGKIKLNADAKTILTGDLTGHSLKADASFVLDSVFSFKGFAEINSKSPDFNKLLYQSAYKEYNWQNNFKNENLKSIGAQMIINKWGNIKATFSIIDNYTYFDEDSKPTQATESLNYFKVKAQQYFTFGKFTMDNTVMYQNVESGSSFFRVPELVTRNTLYFSDYLFPKKPLYLQTGVTFKYFTSYKANAYNPLLSEFVIQNDTEIGNYPMLDFFANAQIRRTRLFFKVENFSASFTGRNYYSAPNYPYRDLTVRFGVVWNFFI
ncbi:putative porin [Lutibacter sp.]|uniref:putative porin n=1 Tax=Lutibacter sp. TaxID=1925666 RepID=UPI0035624B54